MKATTNFADIAPDEQINLAIDFTSRLSPGDTIASITNWTCTVADDSLAPDAAPSSRLIGSPSLSGAVVTQAVGNCLSGVTYVMEALVQTAAGDKLSIWSPINCIPVGQG